MRARSETIDAVSSHPPTHALAAPLGKTACRNISRCHPGVGGRAVSSYEQFVPIARACMHYLTLTSIAESQHRVRRFRTHAAHSKGCEEVFQQLLAAGVSEDTLFEAVIDQQVEVVLTAHPTQVRFGSECLCTRFCTRRRRRGGCMSALSCWW
jgi:hypothetical protein